MADVKPGMTAKDYSRQLTKAYYDGAKHAHENGKFIAYTTAVSPAELFYAHDVIPIYPENHSVMMITHDLGVIAQVADEVAVMYALFEAS